MDHTTTRSRWRSVRLLSISLCAALATSVGVAMPTEAADTAPAAAADEINGVAWNDIDADGANDAEEPGLAGAVVTLIADDGTQVGQVTTGPDGLYSFTGLDPAAGPYDLQVDTPTLYTITDGTAGDSDVVRVAGELANYGEVADVAPGTSVDTGIRPQWEMTLGLVGGQPLSGTPPFDTDDPLCPADHAPGNDCADDDSIVRALDLVSFGWSVSASNPEAVLDDALSDVVLQQTLVPSPGANIEVDPLPSICYSGDVNAGIFPQADGSIVVICDLGTIDQSGTAIIVPITVRTLASADGSTFTSSAITYAVTDDVVVDTVGNPPADVDENEVNAVPFGPLDHEIEITASFEIDLEKRYYNANTAYFDHDADPDTPSLRGRRMNYFIALSYPDLGQEPPVGPLTFTDDMFFTAPDSAVPFGDIEHYMQFCYPNNIGVSYYPLGVYNPNNRPEARVFDSGDCTFSRSGDATSPYTIEISDFDASGTQFPTETWGRGDLSNGPYYFSVMRMAVFIPDRAMDALDGVPDNNTGAGYAYNRLAGFDPVSTSGTSNYNDGFEPGYCDPAVDPYATDPVSSGCDLMPDGSVSNDVVFAPIQITPPSFGWGYDKYYWGPREDLTSLSWNNNGTTATFSVQVPTIAGTGHTGLGIVGPGSTYVSWPRIYSMGGEVGVINPSQCDVFDNTVQTLIDPSGINRIGVPLGGTAPDGYAWHWTLAGPTSDLEGNPVLGRNPEDWTFLFGHLPLTGDDPLAGPISDSSGRYQGDWTEQRNSWCADATPTNGWQTDPNLVSDGTTTGLGAVNAVWMVASDPDAVYARTQNTSRLNVTWAFALEARDTFYGGPNDGELIPSGTVLANHTWTQYQREGQATPTVTPSPTGSNPYSPEPETTGRTGDRLTYARASVLVNKRTIEVDGIGDGAADFGATGNATAGNPVVFEIVPSTASFSGNSVPLDDLTIVDVLPDHMFYDPACTATITGGTPADTVELNTPGDGETTLTWFLPPTVADEPLPALRICVQTDGLAPDPTTQVNSVTIDGTGVFPDTDTHTVILRQVGVLKLQKYVDVPLDPTDDGQLWTLAIENFSELLTIAGPTIIEVFPYNGDENPDGGPSRAPGSDFTGTTELTAEPTAVWANTDALDPAPGVFVYTADAPATVNQDLNLNTSNWCSTADGGTTWLFVEGPGTVDDCPATLADVTAFKFTAGAPLSPQNVSNGDFSRISIDLPMLASGNAPGDLYANAFTATSPDLRQGVDPSDPLQNLFSNRVQIEVYQFVIGDTVFIDVDADGVYTNADLAAPDGTVVELYAGGATPGVDAPLATTSTVGGSYQFAELGEGDYFVVVPESELLPGGNLASWAPVVGDPTEDIDDNVSSDTQYVADVGLVSGTHTLSWQLIGGFPIGDEPLGDNLHGAVLPAGVVDGFTNLTIDLAVQGTAALGDTVWFDADADGVLDAGEPGLEGATVTATWYGPDGILGTDDDLVYTTQTDADGTYLFENLPAGDFQVEVSGVNLDPTYDLDGTDTPNVATVSLELGETNLDVDFGYTSTVSLGDLIFADVDRDGVYDPTVDAAVPDGVVVELYDATGTLVATTTTVDGLYRFDGLLSGDYFIQIPTSSLDTTLAGWSLTVGTVADPNDDVNNDNNGYEAATGAVRTNVITLTSSFDPTTLEPSGSEPDEAGLANLTLDIGFFPPISPSVSIEKSTNTFDADVTTGPLIAVGGDVEWTYVVTNTGDTVLVDLTVTDDVEGTATCAATTLAPAETTTCTLTGVATAGQYANVGSVEATPAAPDGTPFDGVDPVTDDDPSHYLGAVPAVDIEKSVQTIFDADVAPGPTVAADGDVRFTYVVTNTGNVPLTNVVVTDDIEGAITCPQTTLAVAESMTCVLDTVAIDGDYANTGTVDALGPETVDPDGNPVPGTPVTDSDDAHYVGVAADIDVEKTVQTLFDADVPTGPLVADGADVLFTYTVTNTGSSDLFGVEIVDDVEGLVDCPTNVLLVGESMVCTLIVADSADGQYTNVAEATGTGQTTFGPLGTLLPGDEVTDADAANYLPALPAIDVQKFVQTLFDANGGDDGPAIAEGADVLFTYVVTNTGNVPLTGVALTDDVEGAITCPLTELAVGEQMTCTLTAVAVAGNYANVASVTGDGPETIDTDGNPVPGTSVGDTDPANYFGVDPAIAIEKSTQTLFDADLQADAPLVATGDIVKWTYSVTNTGNVPLVQVAVTDDRILNDATINCGFGAANVIPSLSVGQTVTCTAFGTAVTGDYANIGNVTAVGPETVDTTGATVPGETVTADDPSHYVGAEPQIDIEKSVQTLFDADDPTGPLVATGDDVLFTYTVTNTGNVALTDVAVTDDVEGDICVVGELAVDATAVCTITVPAGRVGVYVNTGTATGVGPETVDADGNPVPGVEVVDVDDAHYFGADPAIDLETTVQTVFDADDPTGPLVEQDGDVLITYTVTNTGNVPLTDVVLTDDLYGTDPVYVSGDTNGDGVLDTDEVWTYTLTVPADQVDQVVDSATVTGVGPDTVDTLGGVVAGETVSDVDDHHWFVSIPSVELVKYTQTLDNDEPTGPLVADGADVRWTYEVANTGNVELSNVVVSDDQLDDATIDCGEGTANVIVDLAVGEVVYCEAFGVAVPGQYMNTGSVAGTPPATVGTDGELVEQPPVVDENPDHYFGVAIAIDVEKSVQSVFDADEVTGPLVAVGDEVVWTYVVTNTGNHELVDIELVDDQEGVITCPDTTLAVGASMTCTATGVATAGQYTNVAVVTGTGPDTVDTDGETVPAATTTDEDPANHFGAEPAVEIVKSVNGEDANEAPGVIVTPGDELEFDYVVTNTGNVELFDVTVVDDQGVVVDCGEGTGNTIADLAVGESVTCTGTDVAVDGQYTNIGTVSATGPDTVGSDGEPVPGVEVSDDDPANAFGADPGIEVVKYIVVDGERVDANVEPGPSLNLNSLAVWEIDVTNTGNVVLTDVVVSDPLLDELGVSLSCAGGGNTVARLDPGQSVTCTASNLITEVGLVVNEAIATGIPPYELPSVTDDDVALFTSVPSGGSGIPQLPKTGSNLTLLLLGLAVLTLGSGMFLFGVTRRRRT